MTGSILVLLSPEVSEIMDTFCCHMSLLSVRNAIRVELVSAKLGACTNEASSAVVGLMNQTWRTTHTTLPHPCRVSVPVTSRRNLSKIWAAIYERPGLDRATSPPVPSFESDSWRCIGGLSSLQVLSEDSNLMSGTVTYDDMFYSPTPRPYTATCHAQSPSRSAFLGAVQRTGRTFAWPLSSSRSMQKDTARTCKEPQGKRLQGVTRFEPHFVSLLATSLQGHKRRLTNCLSGSVFGSRLQHCGADDPELRSKPSHRPGIRQAAYFFQDTKVLQGSGRRLSPVPLCGLLQSFDSDR